ncbi:MAG: sulfotransferase [Campylobacterota bacterium]|nr:sulfotransferase [Campylobacterota bacterium]
MINQSPIFLMGSPRSGTSIIQALIDTQKQIITFPPTHFFSLVLSHIKTDIDGNIINKTDIELLIKNEIKYDIWENTSIYKVLNQDILMIKELYESIILHYTRNNKNRWIDKTPNYTYMINIINSYYPNAKFLFVLKDPLNTVYSRKLKLPADKHRSIELLTQYWCNAVSNYKNFKQEYPDKIILIKYEDFAKNYENDMKDIMNFLELKYNKELLKNYKDSISGLIHEKEIWKQDMTTEIMKTDKYNISDNNREIITKIAYKEMEEFGYL